MSPLNLCAAFALLAWTGVAVPADFTCSDPFVVRDDAAGVYRLYHNAPVRGAADPLVMMRTSKDLVDWSEPVGVLTLPKDFNCNSLWAPEVHSWKGKWYLFGTIHKPVDPKNLLPVTVPDFKPLRRKTYLATWTFVADTPEGPFRPFADKAITPESWSSLDGTLFEQDGKPYMVFCHEWTQIRDGTMEAVELAPDLSSAVGKPFTLFKASDLRAAVEGRPMKVPHGVTDGPFLYRTKTGKLLMLWSSAFRGYLQAVSRSESGRLEGPWTHHELIREKDSGHGMVFTTFDGRLALALHSPNQPHANKRLRIFELEDTGDSLKVGRQIGGCFADTAVYRTPAPVEMRRLSLNGLHDFRFVEGKSLEEVLPLGFAANDKMTVPGCWDATSRYYNKRGTGLYRVKFDLDRPALKAFLEVDGCGLRSKYYLDGEYLGLNVLPWSRFELKTGPLSAGRHELVVAVDSIVDNSKAKLFWDFYDFYPFGGFHHGLTLTVQERSTEIRRVVARTRDYRTGRVELEVLFADGKGPADFTAQVAFNGGESESVTFRNRRAELNVPAFRLWSPETPDLTTATVRYGSAAATARFGIRQVGTDKGRITLNGKPVYLKGVNRHEAHYEFGATTPVQLMYEDIQEEIFANRDIGGVMIWQFTDAKTYTRRTRGMINRSYGVNTGGLYDLYRRPKLVVEEVRKLFQDKKD